jgi:DNA repair protein RecO (recombination protein O)
MSEAVTRIRLQPVFLLHQRPYRDSSQLLEVLTVDYGRLGVIGRGSRGPRSRLRGVLRPFAPLLMSMSLRGDLATLTAAEAAAAPAGLDGEGLFAGFYLNELIIRLTERRDPCPAVYLAYSDALAELAAASGALEPALRKFEKRLLDALGYGLLLESEAGTGSPLDPTQWYEYRPEHGPTPVTAGKDAGLRVRGATLLALGEDRLDDEPGLGEARRILRACLDLQLGDRPLKTRQVLRAMKRR